MSRPQIFQYRLISDTITRPSNTTAYAAGDAVSEVTTNDFFTFTDIGGVANDGVNEGNAGGTILTALLTSSGDQSTKLDAELHLFDTTFTEIADNSAYTVSDSEILTCVGVIDFPLANWKSCAACSICVVNEVNLDFVTAAGDRNLYGQLVARNAYTPISAEVFQVRLVVNQA